MFDKILNTRLFSQVFHTAYILFSTSLTDTQISLSTDLKISFLFTPWKCYARVYSYIVILTVG